MDAVDKVGGPQLRRALLHEHGSQLSSTTKHAYKLPVVPPNVKHNVTEKVAQVTSRYFYTDRAPCGLGGGVE